jgi:hypothetical protein
MSSGSAAKGRVNRFSRSPEVGHQWVCFIPTSEREGGASEATASWAIRGESLKVGSLCPLLYKSNTFFGQSVLLRSGCDSARASACSSKAHPSACSGLSCNSRSSHKSFSFRDIEAHMRGLLARYRLFCFRPFTICLCMGMPLPLYRARQEGSRRPVWR